MTPAVTISTKQMSVLTGATQRMLQTWHEKGLVKPAGESDGRNRSYTSEQVHVILRIVRLRQAGIPLRSVRVYLEQEWTSTLRVTEPQVKDGCLLVPYCPKCKRASV